MESVATVATPLLPIRSPNVTTPTSVPSGRESAEGDGEQRRWDNSRQCDVIIPRSLVERLGSDGGRPRFKSSGRGVVCESVREKWRREEERDEREEERMSVQWAGFWWVTTSSRALSRLRQRSEFIRPSFPHCNTADCRINQYTRLIQFAMYI